MTEFFSGIVGETFAPAAVMLFWGIIIIAILLGLARVARRMGNGTFIAGGHNRRPRLAVMDAAAVDSRRRLVLVRRDDIEHLILIGGAADIVVEQNIRMSDRLSVADRHEPVHEEEPIEEELPVQEEPVAAEDNPDPSLNLAIPAAAVATETAFAESADPFDGGLKESEAPQLAAVEETIAEPEPKSEPLELAEPEQAPEPEMISDDIELALLDELEESLEISEPVLDDPVLQPPVENDPLQSLAEITELPAEPAAPPRASPTPVPEQDIEPKSEESAAKPDELEDEMERLLRELSAGGR